MLDVKTCFRGKNVIQLQTLPNEVAHNNKEQLKFENCKEVEK